MTRAEDRLYVCGWEGVRNRPEKIVWYDLVKDGLAGHLTAQVGSDGQIREPHGIAPNRAGETSGGRVGAGGAGTPPRLGARLRPRASGRGRSLPRRGSSLALREEAEALPEQPPLGPLALSENGRYARGRLVHALLQHLPEVDAKDQERAARAFVAVRGIGLTQDLQEEIVAESLAIVRDASFAPLFQPGSLAEVPVVARIGGYDLEGQIDRLARSMAACSSSTTRPTGRRPRHLMRWLPRYIAQLAGYRHGAQGAVSRPRRCAPRCSGPTGRG